MNVLLDLNGLQDVAQRVLDAPQVDFFSKIGDLCI